MTHWYSNEIVYWIYFCSTKLEFLDEEKQYSYFSKYRQEDKTAMLSFIFNVSLNNLRCRLLFQNISSSIINSWIFNSSSILPSSKSINNTVITINIYEKYLLWHLRRKYIHDYKNRQILITHIFTLKIEIKNRLFYD